MNVTKFTLLNKHLMTKKREENQTTSYGNKHLTSNVGGGYGCGFHNDV